MNTPPVGTALLLSGAVEPLDSENLIQKVALACLKELGLSLAMGAAVACFVPSAAQLTVLGGVLAVQVGVSLLLHSARVGSERRSIHSLCGWLNSLNFALFSGLNFQFLLHEMGHALAILSTYKNPRPQILIFPLMGGNTAYHKSALSWFGKMLGPAASTCFVIASGPGLTLLFSLGILSIGLAVKEKWPLLSQYLIGWAVVDFWHHAHYALSANWTDPVVLSHDFVSLSIFGLNPTAAAIALFAMPIVLHLGVSYFKENKGLLQ